MNASRNGLSFASGLHLLLPLVGLMLTTAPASALTDLGEPTGRARIGEPLELAIPLIELPAGAELDVRIVSMASPSDWSRDAAKLKGLYDIEQTHGVHGDPLLRITSHAPLLDLFVELEIQAHIAGQPEFRRSFTVLAEAAQPPIMRDGNRVVLPGETLYSIAAVLARGTRRSVEDILQRLFLTNRAQFGDTPTDLPAGASLSLAALREAAPAARPVTPAATRVVPSQAPKLPEFVATVEVPREPARAVRAIRTAATVARDSPAARDAMTSPARAIAPAAVPVLALSGLVAPVQAAVEPSRLALKGMWSPKLILMLAVPLAATAAIVFGGLMLLGPAAGRGRRGPQRAPR